MDAKELPAHPNLEQYKKQAKELLKACKSGDSEAMWRIRKHRTGGDTASTAPTNTKFVLSDAQFVLAREHAFESWPKFAHHIDELTRNTSLVASFEAAADSIVRGDVAKLESLLREYPKLVKARSPRFHGAPLLHYIAANGVEDFRQKTPRNAVAITNVLLDAGAEVDATSDAYGGKATALGLVATSVHPQRAGIQIPLLQTLLKGGANVDGVAEGWTPLVAALRNGREEASVFLADHGARLDLEGAAGVGRLDKVKDFFDADHNLKPTATSAQMDAGFVWACEYGRNDVVDFLLRHGIDVTTHAKTGLTGLHWAVVGGKLETIKLLLRRGAPLEATNSYGGTVLGQALWSAKYGGSGIDYLPIVQALLEAGAKVDAVGYPTGDRQMDKLLEHHRS